MRSCDVFGCSQQTSLFVQQHANVPQLYQGGLGQWVSKQRQMKRRGKLLQERMKQLVDIGFEWSTARGPPKQGAHVIEDNDNQSNQDDASNGTNDDVDPEEESNGANDDEE